MRNAGVPVEMIAEYVKLCQQGDETFSSRRDLLKSARSQILKQIEKYQTELQRLEYKISRYEAAVETGNLVWDEPDGRNTCEAHG
jgi:DNA-binding transcriptional MerR regulator